MESRDSVVPQPVHSSRGAALQLRLLQRIVALENFNRPEPLPQ